jgi:hypothetical protein
LPRSAPADSLKQLRTDLRFTVHHDQGEKIMARRPVNRMEKRAEYEAYERRQDEEGTDEEEQDEEDEEEDEAAEEEVAEADVEAEEEAEEPKPKKRKREPKTTKARPRSRAAKVTRQKVVWGVFNNSNQRVATFDYPKKHEAEQYAAEKTAEKKQTFFVQPVKEPME